MITVRPTLVRICQLLMVALRAAVWRRTAEPPLLGLGALIGWCLLAMAVDLALNFAGAGPGRNFDIYGINALIGWRATVLVAGVLFAPAAYRCTLLAASLALSILVSVLAAAIPFALSLLPPVDLEKVWGLEARYSGGGLTALYFIWSFGAIFALFRSVVVGGRWNKLLRTAGFFAATLAISHFFPHLPVFSPPDFQIASANIWEAKRAVAIEQIKAKRPRIDPSQLALAQPELLDAAASRLAPHRSGLTDIYSIGVAGYSREDVFVRELNGALGALGTVLPIEGRTLRLINNFAFLSAAPIASLQNFSAAVRAAGRVMNKEEDVLLLFMTSHGTPEGFALAMDEVSFATLRPDHVAAVLDGEGIRNRIIIVSACYSGIFLKPLMSDNSIVLTASDESSPSFGCSSEREWTYFGDALFNHALRPGRSLQQAFDEAKRLIASWEQRESLPPSNPQAHFGPALVQKLAPLYLTVEGTNWPSPPSFGSGNGAAKR